MRKGLILFKRLVAIFLVLLFSINTFAALVGDNDGAAFITKAEFDSMKNDFQNQLDRYNSSIDNKIDGAIASYLSGIQIAKNVTYKLVCKNEKINFINGHIDPEFRVPAIYMNMSAAGFSIYGTTNYKEFSAACQIVYDGAWTDGETNKKPLVKVINGDESAISGVCWDGVALRYKETFVYSKNLLYEYSDIGYMDDSGATLRLLLQNPFAIKPIGYVDKMELANLVDMNCQYQYKGSASYYTGVNPKETKLDSNVTQLKCELGFLNGERKIYEHIIQYDAAEPWEVYNNEFVNTLNSSSLQTITDTTACNILRNYVIKNTGKYVAVVIAAHTGASGWWRDGTIKFDFSAGSAKLASIGKLNRNYTANEIWQAKGPWLTNFTDSWEIKNLTLEKGLPVFALEDGESVKWNVSFPSVYCTNDGSSYVNNQNEVDIYVAKIPFTNKVEVSNNDKLIKFEDESGIEHNYITTIDRKAELRWISDEKTPIYIKCVPHFSGTSYINKDWNIEMDLTGDYGNVSITTAK